MSVFGTCNLDLYYLCGMYMNRPIFKIILFITGVMLLAGGACPSNDTTASNKVVQSEISELFGKRERGEL